MAMAVAGRFASAETFAVPADHTTIQAAIDVAEDGDLILVASGDHVGTIDFGGKAITVRGAAEGPPTRIDGEGTRRGVKFHSAEDAGSVLEYITIADCSVSGDGAAMLVSSGSAPTIRHCIFRNSKATERGGGAAIRGGAAPAFIDCTFDENTAGESGGGVWCRASTPVFVDCRFTGNDAGVVDEAVAATGAPNGVAARGGGIAVTGQSTILLDACNFQSNRTGGGRGAGLDMVDSTLYAATTVFQSNENLPAAFDGRSGPGGGAAGEGATSMSFKYCSFIGNHTAGDGGGIGSGAGTALFLDVCVFLNNEAHAESGPQTGGGGVACEGVATITGSVFDANHASVGGALQSGPESTSVSNSTFSSNDADDAGGAVASTGPLDLANLRVEMNSAATGAGGIAIGEIAGGGIVVLAESIFCRNGEDIDGTWTDGGGNDFWGDDCCLEDLDHSLAVDLLDIFTLFAHWGPCVGCPEDLSGDGVVNVTDLLLVLSAWGPCGG